MDLYFLIPGLWPRQSHLSNPLFRKLSTQLLLSSSLLVEGNEHVSTYWCEVNELEIKWFCEYLISLVHE
jgi:hypothetical protein